MIANRTTSDRCVGIELSERLAERARADAAALYGRRAPVDVVTADASVADYGEGHVHYGFAEGPQDLRGEGNAQ